MRRRQDHVERVSTDATKSTLGVTDTARTTSPRKVCEKTTRPRRACEYERDEENAGRDGYHEDNEPTQGV